MRDNEHSAVVRYAVVVSRRDRPEVIAAAPPHWRLVDALEESAADVPGFLIVDPTALSCAAECGCAARWRGWSSVLLYSPAPNSARAILRHIMLDPVDVIVAPFDLEDFGERLRTSRVAALEIELLKVMGPAWLPLPDVLLAAYLDAVLGLRMYQDARMLANHVGMSRRSLDRAMSEAGLCTVRRMLSVLHTIRAVSVLRASRHPLKAVVASTGARSVDTLRRRFHEVFGASALAVARQADREIAHGAGAAMHRAHYVARFSVASSDGNWRETTIA